MMQVITKWKISLTLKNGQHPIIYISDNHFSNVLRKLAEIEFESFIMAVDIRIDIPKNEQQGESLGSARLQSD